MNEPKVCIRINLAGKEYKDKQGKLWYTDRGYAKGSWGCLNLPEIEVKSM